MASNNDVARLDPTPEVVDAARLSRALILEAAEKLNKASGPIHLEEIDLPVEVIRVVLRIVEGLAEGHALMVSIERLNTEAEELTTSQAARLLGMSRPTLIGLLHRGEMRYRMVGTHRRIPLAAVLEYQRRAERGGPGAREPSREEQARGLREMAEFTNSLGLGY